MANGTESITDDELLYRRVPATTQWYDPTTRVLNAQAFAPHKHRDATGLSVVRAKHRSVEEAGTGRPGKVFYVAVLRAVDLRQNGIEVVQTPPDDPAHAELPSLNAGNRREDETLERQRLLTELCLRVEGPFLSPDE